MNPNLAQLLETAACPPGWARSFFEGETGAQRAATKDQVHTSVHDPSISPCQGGLSLSRKPEQQSIGRTTSTVD